jgi:hypothetical protein
MKYPDEGSFPDTKGEVLDRAGLKDTGYHDKWATPYGNQGVSPSGITGYIFNRLPPGDNIQDQMVSRAQDTYSLLERVKEVTDRGYPGDGWE